jgi:hypothetical protein
MGIGKSSSHHERTMELVGRRWLERPGAESQLRALDAALGRSVPSALRELLLTDAWPTLLEDVSNGDQPLAIEKMLQPRWAGYDAVSQGVLPFMVENQGVCTWAIRLDGCEDPEVVIEIDSGTPPTWEIAASSFSEWLHHQVHDRKVIDSAMFSAQAPPLSPDTPRQLAQALSPGPETFGWPAAVTHRFSSHHGSLLLWSGDDQSDWWIAPRSLDAARALLDALPRSEAFHDWPWDVSPQALPVFDAWRSARAGS